MDRPLCKTNERVIFVVESQRKDAVAQIVPINDHSGATKCGDKFNNEQSGYAGWVLASKRL
jgi:hypothetical protein